MACNARPVFAQENVTSTEIETTDWKAIIISATGNPALLAALMTLIWNIGGYIATCLHNKKLEPYDKAKLLETLTIFESVILLLQGVAGLPTSWAATLALILNFTWSFKKAVSDFTATLGASTEKEKDASPSKT